MRANHFLRCAVVLLAAGPEMFASATTYEHVEELAADLRSLAAGLAPENCSDRLSSLPSGWTVRTSASQFTVPKPRLDTEETLCASDKADDQNAGVKSAKFMFNRLAALLAGSQSSNRMEASARPVLADILNGSEFHASHRRSWLQDARTALLEWIYKILRKFVRSGAARPTALGLFYTFLAAGLIVVIWLVVRWWRALKRPSAIAASAYADYPLRETWQSAIERARADGDYNRAILASYWAGVAALQAARVLPVNPSATPRDFLGWLSQRPENSERSSALSFLTKSLERHWYRHDPAREPDLEACLERLTALNGTAA